MISPSKEDVYECIADWEVAPGKCDSDLYHHVSDCAVLYGCDRDLLLEEVRWRIGRLFDEDSDKKLQRVREFCEKLREDDGRRSFIMQFEMQRIANKVLEILEGDDE